MAASSAVRSRWRAKRLRRSRRHYPRRVRGEKEGRTEVRVREGCGEERERGGDGSRAHLPTEHSIIPIPHEHRPVGHSYNQPRTRRERRRMGREEGERTRSALHLSLPPLRSPPFELTSTQRIEANVEDPESHTGRFPRLFDLFGVDEGFKGQKGESEVSSSQEGEMGKERTDLYQDPGL